MLPASVGLRTLGLRVRRGLGETRWRTAYVGDSTGRWCAEYCQPFRVLPAVF